MIILLCSCKLRPATRSKPDLGRIQANRRQFDQRAAANIVNIERFAFYDRAKTAFAVVATGEKALYANIILKKGVVVE